MRFVWAKTNTGVGVALSTYDGYELTFFQYRTLTAPWGENCPIRFCRNGMGAKKFWSLPS
jgi:hypothetical protein